MKRPKKEESGSLDSLLDTMTNVVGILIIVLVVTQLGVADAIKRMLMAEQNIAEATPDIDDITIDKEKLKTASLEKTVEKLKTDSKKAIALAMIDDTNKARDQIKGLQDRLKQPVKKADPKTLENEANKKKKERDDLAKQLKSLEGKMADLKARLAKTPKPGKAPPPKIVNLPDPRPAQKGARAEYFLCREGKVYHANIDIARKQGDAALRSLRLKVNAKKQIDPKPLINFFKTRQLGDRHFHFRLVTHNYIARISLERKKNAGEDAKKVREQNSYFQSVLRLIKARKLNRYIRFVVWPDSYETYLAARSVCDAHKLAAGWEPTGRREDFYLDFSKRLEIIGKPPPKPSTSKPDEMAKPPKKDPLRREQID